jgi:hypothetical protein
MADPADALILDLVEWVAARPRSYNEVMEAWRTSCPRLTIWEDAVDRGYLLREPREGGAMIVTVTASGRELLRKAGRSVGAAA